MGPDLELTPGELCTAPDSYRYPSQMAYCERNVLTKDKWVIFEIYMKKFNFVVDSENRDKFKIDHYIPLCMGGANSYKNLWPQHESIYLQSDELELLLCERLAEGKITQEVAIQKIKAAKLHLQLIPGLIKEAIELK